MSRSGGEPGPNPDKQSEVFVGRAETLRAVDAYAESRHGAFRLRAVGTWGMGKSSLTRTLKRRVAKTDAVAIRVEMGNYAPPRTAPGRDPSTKTLVHNFHEYCEFLGDLAAATPGKAFRRLEQEAGAAFQQVRLERAFHFAPTVEFGGGAELGDHADIASFTYNSGEDPELDARILALKGSLEKQFVRELQVAGRSYGIILLLDDFEKICGQPMATWVLELVGDPDLDSVVVLVAVNPGVDVGDSSPLERYDLERFSSADVEEYLRQRFGPADPALVEQVVDFSDGLPHAVAMAADVVAARVRRGEPARLDGVSSEEWSSGTASLLTTIVAEVPDDDDRVVLRKGRLARRLDDAIIGTLLLGRAAEEGSAESERVTAVRERLLRYSFVDRHEDPHLGPALHFHDYIRHVDVAPTPPLSVDVEQVHRALAQHYERLLDEYDEEQALEHAPYGCYYKYEHPAWQKLVREWAYHAAQLRAADHEAARIFLACTFLEAFWWWGCYVKFPFCEALLDEWDAAHADGDTTWSNLLRVVLASYPPGHDKDDQPGWPVVEKALVQMRTTAGIHSKSARLEPSAGDDAADADRLAHRRRLRALTSLLLGHTYKFRAPYRRFARPFFDDALTWLERCDDQVAVAWTRFEVAELSSALGGESSAAARDELAEAARTTLEGDEGDFELLANLHRLDGDLHWAAGEVDEAVDAIVRAVVRASVFQVDPHPPDLYTVTFYEEMLTRLGGRVAAVARDRGEAAGLSACHRARAGTAALRLHADAPEPADDELRAALARGGRDLALLLAPAPPPLACDRPDESSFVTDACMALTLLSAQLEEEDRALAPSA